jgi:hypothetical protein
MGETALLCCAVLCCANDTAFRATSVCRRPSQLQHRYSARARPGPVTTAPNALLRSRANVRTTRARRHYRRPACHVHVSEQEMSRRSCACQGGRGWGGGSSWQPEVTRPARRLLGLGQYSSAELHATCGSVRATQGRKHRPDGGPTFKLSGSELDSDAGKRRDQNAET